ncbi:unnamed protein product [Phytophthora lilii]|uniref:Unnamed protein product n=1 Tax=Phytophthora lilii TaxID=2077276 RepID=A0A9W6TKI6_9STRA|nr:unnamed protein product [Phytophthora lilii]
MTHARQPAGTPVIVPQSAAFQQIQHLDAVRASLPEQDREEALYQTLAVRLNGSSEFQLTFNVQELRSILGLPPHNVLRHGIFQSFELPPEPTDDIEDVDHQED